jgi:hypothetical protein
MKIGKKKLKMGDVSIRTFRSKAVRDRFEKVAKAINRVGNRNEERGNNTPTLLS